MILNIVFMIFIVITPKSIHAFFLWDDDEYYTTSYTKTEVYTVYPQDDIDAQAIVDSNMSEQVIASIIPFREKNRRIVINKRITVKNGGKAYIDDLYNAAQPGTPRYKDVVFGLAYDEGSVISTYLGAFMEAKDETTIIMGLILTKDMQQMMITYDAEHISCSTFASMHDAQRKPFKNMMRVWISQSREPNEKCELNHDDVVKDANALKSENDKGGWHEDRAQIEKVLMKKSYKYAKAVIKEFEATSGNPLEEIIQGNVQAHGLNHDLADAYAFLTRFIKNKHKFIADKLGEYSNGADKWAIWIMCLAALDAKEWPKVNEEFKKEKGKSLSEFIVEKCKEDSIMAEMMAVVIDPSYKPTKFSKKPTEEEAAKPCTPPPTTPTSPVAPTTPVVITTPIPAPAPCG